MSISELYKNLVVDYIGPYLRSQGFKQEKSVFRIIKNENLGIIDFQKSKNSNASSIVFTVNLSIILRTIFEFEGHHVPFDTLGGEHSHWGERLGYLMPDHKDIWWTIDESSNVENLALLLINLIERYGITALMRYTNNEQLLELWLSGEAPGLTELQRLEYLSVLLKTMGKSQMLSQVVQDLRKLASGKPIANSVEAHIRLLDEKINT